MHCPCHSNKSYIECCQPFIENKSIAETAEQLMRSRYCAYAMANADYIMQTYSNKSRLTQSKSEIESWAKQCQWVNLVIHSSKTKNNQTAQLDKVEFSAYFIEDKQLCEMREISRFIIENNHWRYHDGEIIENRILPKVKRNELCPCQSNNKFKQCCGRYLS